MQQHTNTSKRPPQAIEVERGILGAMMVMKESLSIAFEHLTEDEFYDPKHKKIFKVIKSLYLNNDPVDAVSVVSKGLDDYVYTLTAEPVSDIEYYCGVLIEKSKKRKLIQVAHDIINKGYDESVNGFDALDEAQEKVFELSKQDEGRTHDIADTMQTVIAQIQSIQEHGKPLGLMTGLDIDDITQGFEKGKFYVIAARPSMGKTAFALSIMRNLARQGKRAGILSLETSHESLGFRLLTTVSKIDGYRLKSGNLTKDEMLTLLDSASELSGHGIYLDDTLSMSDQQLRAKIRQLKQKHKLDIVFIDFLQLLTANADSREQEVAKISRAMKIACKECEIPVVALSQLNRGVEARNNRQPGLADLRESGAIEQDADCVMFLYRPEYYGIDQYENGESTENVCEIIVGKNKDGMTGTKKLVYIKEQMRFENMAHSENKAPF